MIDRQYKRDLKGNLLIKPVGIEPTQVNGFDVVSTVPKYIKYKYEVDLIKGTIKHEFILNNDEEMLKLKINVIDKLADLINEHLKYKLKAEKIIIEGREYHNNVICWTRVDELRNKADKSYEVFKEELKKNNLNIEFRIENNNTFKIVEALQ